MNGQTKCDGAAKPLAQFLADMSGGLATVAGFSLPLAAIVAGLAVDFGRAEYAKTAMQRALDSAVLAYVEAPASDAESRARATFAANLKETKIDALGAKFTVAADGTVSAKATGEVPTTLLSLMRIASVRIAASAASDPPKSTSTTTTVTTSSSQPVCVLLMNKSASQALLINSGAYIDASNCEFQVNSTGAPAAIYNAGSTVLTAKTCIVGTSIIDNGGIHPNVTTGCVTLADPYSGALPTPTVGACTVTNATYSGSVYLSPGVYCGWTNFNAAPNVTLVPGLYVIKGGGWNVDGGSFSGHGVTFYFADSSAIQFNSGMTSDITAPSSGTYSGILMFEPDGLSPSPFVWDDSVSSSMEGLVYLPSRNATFNSYSSVSGDKLTLVLNTLIADGTGWNLDSSAMSIAGSTVTTVTTVTTTTDSPVSLVR